MVSINTNTGSLYAAQAMTLNSRSYTSTVEHLSTGKRLNSFSDNVAGMAISIGLNSQIKSLNQAVRNADDGSSLFATADGALVQIENMLQRMRELSIQSVSSDLNTQDRTSLDFEFQQLKTQIGKVSSTTEWNGINVLNGVVGSDWEGKFNFQVGSTPDQTIGAEILNLEQTPPIDVTGGNNLSKKFVFNSGVSWNPTLSDPTDPYSYDPSASQWNSLTDDPFPSFFAAFGRDPAIPQEIGGVLGSTVSLKVNGVQVASAQVSLADLEAISDFYFNPSSTNLVNGVRTPTGTELSTTMIAKLKTAFGQQAFDGGYLTIDDSTPHVLSIGYVNRDGGATGHGTSQTTSDDNFTITFSGINDWAKLQVDPEQRFDLSVLDSGNETSATAQDQYNRVINANFGNGSQHATGSYTVTQTDIDAVDHGTPLSKTIADWFAAHLTAPGIRTDSSEPGVLTVNWASPSPQGTTGSVRVESNFPLSSAVISSSDEASRAISNVDSAMNALSSLRAKISMTMKALGVRSELLDTMSVKLQEAAGRLMDTDYAQMTSDLVKQKIIQNAGLAMLAQANQSPYFVLQLLKH